MFKYSLFFGVFLGAIATPAFAETHRTTQIPCPTPVAAEEVDGKTTVCGILTVPENYSKPHGRQIEISYAIYKSKSLSPQPDPLIVLHGGPGGTDMNVISGFTSYYAAQRQTRDVILFDQRGSRFSGDLMCAPTKLGLNTITQDPKSEGATQFDKYQSLVANIFKTKLSGFDYSDNLAGYAFFKICSEVLQRAGFDLNQYNTSTNARDVVNLADALGYNKINLYGISYGTYLAMRVMRDFPERLRSVVLDSTIPPNVNKYEAIVEDLEVALLNLLEDCGHDSACNRAYPNLKSRTIKLINSLAQKPIPLSKDQSIGINEIAALITSINQDLDGRKAAYLPLIISELERGITKTYVGVVTGTIFPKPATKPFPIDSSGGLLAKAEEYRNQARKLLTETAVFVEFQRPSQQWVKKVLQAIETLPEAQRPLARVNFYGVGYDGGKPRNRQTLISAVNEIFPQDKRQALVQPLQSMNAAEVRHTYESISSVLRTVDKGEDLIGYAAFRSFDCQDLAPALDLKRAEANLKALAMPALGQPRFSAARDSMGICLVWPVKPAPISDRQAVKSNIPTLVFQGRYDIQTNSRVGRQSVVGLSNSTLLEFPNSGHAVLLFSQCARDVGASFVNDPTRTPNADCREELKPKFVLPTASK
jgi:pimeloyl-ACP methyl ester carboxylesterase